MEYHVVILSEDTVFSRMIELEFQLWHLRVLATDRLNEADRAEVLLLDLDSSAPPSSEQYRRMIGFSRRSATATAAARSCSMILRRPFRMRLLRREVLELIEAETRLDDATLHRPSPREREIRLFPKERRLICDREELLLSPTECDLLQCLLENRGKAVDREALSRVIGGEETNKIDVYVCYLRRKTDGLPNGRLIKTVRNAGYMIE